MKTRVVLIAMISVIALADGYAGAASITGCLSGPTPQGVYLLTRSEKPHRVAVGGDSDLPAHVGHTVKLTGEWAKNGADIGEMGKDLGAKHGHFKVTDVEHISDTCSK